MLRLLQSIFGKDTRGGYPESLIREAVERTVEGTDPWLRAVSGYRKKLRPAIIRAIEHVVSLVDDLPPPVPMGLAGYSDDRILKSFFISAVEMKQILANDASLAPFREGRGAGSARVFALLAMEKQETVAFGAGLSGDVVIRDVAQVTVSFAAHRFLDPSRDEAETRRLLKRRAFDHLLSLALKRLAGMKSDREDLERRRTLLQAKLNLLEREGWGFDRADAAVRQDVAAVEDRIGEIELQLLDLGGDDMLDAYLATVADVVGRPGEYLWARHETIFVDRMGIKHPEPADDVPEIRLNMLYSADGRSQAVLLVALEKDELRGLAVEPANARSSRV